MSIEWITIASEGLKRLLFDALPSRLTEYFGYRLALSFTLRNQRIYERQGKVHGPIISVFVTIRNTGSRDEYIHRCGFDGSHAQGAAMSSMMEWKPPMLLGARSLHECELRFSQDHNPAIKAVWVENGLQRKWFLKKKELAKLNKQLASVVARNKADLDRTSKS